MELKLPGLLNYTKAMRNILHHALLAVLLIPLPSWAQTTTAIASPEELKVARDAEKSAILKQLISCPVLHPATLSEVIRIGVDKRHLTVSTCLPATGTQSRVDITDLPGICTLTSHQIDKGTGGRGPYEPDLFLLEWYRFDEPNSTVSGATVEALPTSVQISSSSETLSGMTQVILVEQVSPTGPAGDPTPPNILLRASSQAKNGNTADTQFELKAPDFLSLRREHPEEVEQYLGALFRELHTDAADFSDTVLAWQVFSSEATLSREQIDKVRAAVKQLDADDYKDRQAASKVLEQMGPEAAIELSRLDRTLLSPEQTSVVDGLIKEFNPVSPDIAKRLADEPAFLLTCLTDEDNFVVHTALTHLQKVVGRAITFDIATRGQIRRDAVQHLRERLSTYK